MRALIRKLAKFNALTWPERKTFLAAQLQLPLFWVGLHVLGLQRFQRWLQRRPFAVAHKLLLDEMMRMGMMINIAARHSPFPATCLTRSLLLCWLLRRKGVDAQLRIGARLTDGTLDAHAWVEHTGVPVNDRQDVSTQYAPFNGAVSSNSFFSP